jgi:hypothetical protein
MSGDAHTPCMEAGEHICQQPSGRTCVEPDCTQGAGTWWGPYWCPEHDKERLDRISDQLDAIGRTFHDRQG